MTLFTKGGVLNAISVMTELTGSEKEPLTESALVEYMREVFAPSKGPKMFAIAGVGLFKADGKDISIAIERTETGYEWRPINEREREFLRNYFDIR